MNESICSQKNTHPLAIAAQQLTDVMMEQRTIAIERIEGCVRALLALRQSVATDEVDNLLFGYRTILRFLVSIRPDSVPSQDEANVCLDDLQTLQHRLEELMQSNSTSPCSAANPCHAYANGVSETVSNLTKI
jgi:hypothetical protein